MKSRKVQVTGGGTYFVTLPKSWAEGVGITRGCEVKLHENATGSLLVMPQSLKRGNRISICLDGKDSSWIERAIISCYITGFDVIEGQAERISPTQRGAVREATQALVGLEIMDETQDHVSLHCVVSVSEFEVNVTLKRILAITSAMMSDAVTSFVNVESDLAKDVIQRDMEADRLTLLVYRELGLLLRDLLLESEIGMSRVLFHEYKNVAKTLERTGDHAVKISRAALSLSTAPSDETTGDIIKLDNEAETLISKSVEAFMNADVDLAQAVLEGRDTTEEWERNAHLYRDSEDPQLEATIFDSLLRVRDYAFNIAETAINIGIPGQQDDSKDDTN